MTHFACDPAEGVAAQCQGQKQVFHAAKETGKFNSSILQRTANLNAASEGRRPTLLLPGSAGTTASIVEAH